MSDVSKESLFSVRDKIRNREITALEVTEALLDRIENLDSLCNSYTLICGEEARKSALQADEALDNGKPPGVLHGVPVAVKDIIDVAGVPTQCGSQVRNGHTASEDAFVIRRLKEAGAIILGKLNMTEFALSSYHPDVPLTTNPWSHSHWAGASSSGSAVAVAMGLAYGSLATDTGGSIRLPSAYAGIVGIKPSFGTVSRRGCFPLAFSLDHIGTMARNVADAAIMLEVIRAYDSSDPFSRSAKRAMAPTENLKAGARGLRIGVDTEYNSRLTDSEISSALSAALDLYESIGAEIVPVDILGTGDVARYWSSVVAAEASVGHKETFPEKANLYGTVFRSLLESGQRIGAARIVKSRIATARASQIFHSAFASCDVILCPAVPTPSISYDQLDPFALIESETAEALSFYTAPMNFCGIPSIALPCGYSESGLPLGMQLIGPRHSEPVLVQAAHAYEEQTKWNIHWPPLVG